GRNRAHEGGSARVVGEGSGRRPHDAAGEPPGIPRGIGSVGKGRHAVPATERQMSASEAPVRPMELFRHSPGDDCYWRATWDEGHAAGSDSPSDHRTVALN